MNKNSIIYKAIVILLLSLFCNSELQANCSATASISGNKTACQNSTNSYIGGYNKFYTYKWTVLSGGIILSGAAKDTVSVMWTGSGKGVLKLVVLNGPCTDSTTDTVTINPLPTANAGIDDSVCYGDSVQIGMKAIAGDKYSWTSYSGSTYSVSNPWVSPFHNNHYYLKVTDSITGCISLDTVNINVTPIPSRPSFASNNNPCEGDSIKFTCGSVSGATYSWLGDNGYTSSTQNPFITSAKMSDTGYYGVRVTVNGCTSSYRYTFVYVHSLPVPNITGGLTACTNSSKTYTASSGSSYSWSVTGGKITSGAGTNSVSVSWGSAGKGSISLSVSNTFGCSGTVTDSVTINPLPTVNAGADDSVCYGDSVQIGASPATNFTYSWTSYSGSKYNVSNPWVSPFKTNYYYLKGTDTMTGCSNMDTVAIKVNQLPSRPSFTTNNGPLCEGDTLKLSCGSVSGATYSWLGDNGYTSSTQNPVISFTTLKDTGFYGVRSIVSGCYSAFRYTFVRIYKRPVPSASGNQSVCAGSSQTYFASTTSNTYKWRASGGTVSSASKNSVSILWGSAGTGIITLIETNSNGCSDSTTDTVSILALPSANAGLDDSICPGGSASIGTAPTPQHGYSWSSSPAGYTNTSSSATVSPASTTTYYVKEMDSLTGCSASDFVTIKVNSTPTAHFGYDSTCLKSNTSFYDSSTVSPGTISSWKWNFGDGITSTSKNPKHIYTAEGNYAVKLIAMSSSGCSDTTIDSVRIYPYINPKFSYTITKWDVQFLPSDTITKNRLWNFDDGNTDNTIKPLHSYLGDGKYHVSLYLYNGKGCAMKGMDTVVLLTTGFASSEDESFQGKIYPNPFRENLNMEYTLEKSMNVNIGIYSPDGKLISTIINQQQETGKHQVQFTPEDNLSQGVYILRMIAGVKVITKQIIRTR